MRSQGIYLLNSKTETRENGELIHL